VPGGQLFRGQISVDVASDDVVCGRSEVVQSRNLATYDANEPLSPVLRPISAVDCRTPSLIHLPLFDYSLQQTCILL